MTLLSILMALALLLNALLAVVTVRSVGDLRRQMELREELDADWRRATEARLRSVEARLRRPRPTSPTQAPQQVPKQESPKGGVAS